MMRLGGFKIPFSRLWLARRWMLISYIVLAVGAGLTLPHCSDGEVSSTVCRGGDTKRDGRCVSASSEIDINSSSPPNVDPMDPGSELDPTVLSWDAKEATFSIAIEKLELTDEIEVKFKDKFSKEDDEDNEDDEYYEYKKAYPVVFTVRTSDTGNTTRNYYGWKDHDGHLEAYMAFPLTDNDLTAERGNISDSTPDADDPYTHPASANDPYYKFYNSFDSSETTSPDCMVLPGKHVIDEEQKAGKFYARIWFEDGDVKVKFVEAYRPADKEDEEPRKESVKDLKQLLGLQGYSVDELKFTNKKQSEIGSAINTNRNEHTLRIVQTDDITQLNNVVIKAVIANVQQKWDEQKSKDDLDDNELCFNKLYAKQHGSENKEPGSSAKIFPYKARTYNGYLSRDGTDNGKEGDYLISNASTWMFDPKVTFYLKRSADSLDPINKSGVGASSEGQISLSLKGAAYLIMHADPTLKEEFTGRAAPSKQKFSDTMTQLIRVLAES